ncbi:MAG: hypothetical protein GWP91_06250 [Rhodobacterales bacterium]|nr:hypothetical protein [Rhodobacterales bacterium]
MILVDKGPRTWLAFTDHAVCLLMVIRALPVDKPVGIRSLWGEKLKGTSALKSSLSEHFLAHGFARGYRALERATVEPRA